MMIIEKDIFEKIVSAATNSDTQVYDMVQPHFAWTEQQLNVELIGDEFLDNLEFIPGFTAVVMRLICLRTFAEQIPHLDLVLTPTGFGVVSNQNVAPASADRVKALRKQVEHAYQDTYDRALEMLVGTPWADSTQARCNIVNMIYTAKQFRRYVDKPNAHRQDLEAAHAQIYVAEEKVREHISSEFFDFLLEKVRKNDMTKQESGIISMICKFTGLCVMKEYTAAKSLLARIENYAEDNLSAFPNYENSKAYKAKHFKGYENQAGDSTFFFG